VARTRRPLVPLLLALAAAAGPGGALADTPPAPSQPSQSKPYTIPDAPQVPLVAALTLPPHQTLRGVLARGLLVNLYAYRSVTVRLKVLVPPRTATRIGLGSWRVVANRLVVARKPDTYRVRLRFTRRARSRLRHLRSVQVMIRSALSANGARSTSTTPVRLA
jgi:hypothetical protein